MIDPNKKSTDHSPDHPAAAIAEIGDGLVLDGRLALVDPAARWLAVADLHFGYEANRRREGALWPLWGMESIAARLENLVRDWQPETVILAGDIVDGSAAPDQAIAWIGALGQLGPRLILVEGNHDRGPVRKAFDWVTSWQFGDIVFEHGHLDAREGNTRLRIRGHLHPSILFSDGSGTRLRLPSLVVETAADGSRRITLPAFSPWAGGTRLQTSGEKTLRQWACSPQRVFEIVG
ncbi:MAG: metallophosphoesterase [Verrucomicrobiae bacterium]|nr:metallophosphoesterase [Verrucomicrobiae bacterium]